MKVAAVQMDVKILEKSRNLEKILANFDAACRAGAKLVVFPECALSGYCFTGRDEAWPASETVPGPATNEIARLARQRGATAVVGLLERDGELIYNAAAVISPQGVLGTHRKVHLLCLGIDRFDAPGNKPFPIFETPQGKIGINICYDSSFPEAGRVVKLKGGEILAIPTNWPVGSDSWQHTPKVRATENHMHVIAADRVGVERGFGFSGHSQIINFEGQVLAEAGETEETIVYGEIDVAAANHNLVVRRPGEWEFDRIAARRPEMYGEITQAVERLATISK